MTEADRLLAQYLRQNAELGGDEIYLDTMTSAEAMLGLRTRITEALHPHPVPAASVSPEASTVVRETITRTLGAPDASPATGNTGYTAPLPVLNSVLPVLAQRAFGCTLCRLWEGRTQVVFGEGAANAELLVVGEAPGQEEDKTGRPFVGRAGKLLDLLLLTAGFPREKVYICNVLKCRPPGNRNPLPDEVEVCTTNYLFPQLDAIAPRAILAVGKFAAQALLQSEETIGRLRGVQHTYRGMPLIVTYHPAYLLRSPQMTRVAWDDYQLVRKVLDGTV